MCTSPIVNTFYSRVRVKICGITNPEDAENAIDAGADALGFNGYSGSKRYINLLECAGWIAKLPSFVSRIAVLVNPQEAEGQRLADTPGIDVLQFHGTETPEFCRRVVAGGTYIKALAAKDRQQLEECRAYDTKTILLDAYVPGAFGGTGHLIDLDLAAEFVRRNPQLRVVLSGGLTVENVAEAVRRVRPYAVDVASGVEASLRKKDKILMGEFIAAAREANCWRAEPKL